MSNENGRYRRALSNNCTETALLRYSPRRQKCPSQAPRGLQLFTSEGTLVATLERNVTFLVFLEQVEISRHKRANKRARGLQLDILLSKKKKKNVFVVLQWLLHIQRLSERPECCRIK